MLLREFELRLVILEKTNVSHGERIALQKAIPSV
jgi:hypothetical protein